jgi:hypothetical protein
MQETLKFDSRDRQIDMIDSLTSTSDTSLLTSLTSITTTQHHIKMAPKHPFDLSKCARPNILKLQPYRCARE